MATICFVATIKQPLGATTKVRDLIMGHPLPHEPEEWTEQERQTAKIHEYILATYPTTKNGDFRCRHCGSLF